MVGGGELLGRIGRNRRKLAEIGRIGRDMASVRFRQPPLTPVDIRDMCGWKMEDGGLLGKGIN